MNRVSLQLNNLKLLTLLNVLIGLTVFFFILLFIRDIAALTFGSQKTIEKQIPARSTEAPTRPVPFEEYGTIMKNNPFGPSGGTLELLSNSDKASAGPGDLKLLGTISGYRGYGYAIFSDNAGKQELFKVGQPVFAFGSLKDVDRARAVIKKDGRFIEIPLIDQALIEEVPQSQGRSLSGKPGTSDFVRSLGKGTFIVDQKTILRALENPHQLMTDARLQPNVASGKQEGFVLREVKNGGIYQNLGLQNGDVLLRINNYDITHPDNALQAFTALRGMDRVDLDIVRNNVKMTLTYQIK